MKNLLVRFSAFVLVFTMVFQYGINSVSAAVSFDAAACQATSDGGDESWDLTVGTGSDTGLFVWFESSNAVVTSVTYDSISMTHVSSSIVSADAKINWYWLAAPS